MQCLNECKGDSQECDEGRRKEEGRVCGGS
jgi:hypothetical protein